MTALEIHSIVASCKYSNWQWIMKDKTQKNYRLLDFHKAFCAKSGKQAKRSLETDAAAGSASLELQTPWPQGLRANLFPWKNFDALSKTWSLWTPGEIKGPNRLSEKTVCVERQELCLDFYGHINQLVHSRFLWHFLCWETQLSISFRCDPSWDCMLSIWLFYAEKVENLRDPNQNDFI